MSCCEGFRLTGSPSEHSLRNKARIDALFEDSRSICSSNFGWSAPVADEPATEEQQRKVNSAVQARIEAMFASVEAESGTPGECAAAILPVRYMGAAPVGGRVASVRGLQEPLRQLLERIDESAPAELEVSRRGLTFRTSEIFEKTNPFRRIAVWSALRLRCRNIATNELHHAFMPLVGDEHGVSGEEKHADLYRTMRGLTKQVESYPPIFAVVMRRPGAARLLECHAFACYSEEDAVAAAATLYRALLADLDTNRRRPRHANGVGCVSLASVVSSARDGTRDQSPSSKAHNGCCSSSQPSQSALDHPVRPPRVKKNMACGVAEEEQSNCVEQIPRRKKKVSEINAEDVLEARSRKLSAASSREDSAKSLDEERLNKKNKTCGSTQEVNFVPNSESDLQNNENRVDESKSGSKTSRSRSGSRGNDFSEEKQNAKKVSTVYKKNDSHPRKDVQNSETDYRSLENSLYERTGFPNRTQSYEDHFRDADKIYSLGQEDICSPRCKNQAQDEVQNCVGNRRVVRQASRNWGSMYSRRSNVSTLDCPSQRQQTSHSNGCCQPRQRRRRSRAGSEPPTSRSEEVISTMQETRLKRSQSDFEVEKGDPMTRVELPRRSSFLNPGSKRRTANIKDGTPLGFTELFDEFRNQEGLTSVDDILAAIINPEGMSFNDLKPLYKEFLLKLASTLTQDELYQRSASIMRRRRRPQRRRSTRRPCLLSRAIKRSVSRLKSGPTEFTSVIFSARRLNESFGSSSSCDVRNNHRNRVLSSRLERRRPSHRRVKHRIGQTTSEDSDTCRRLARSAGANRSSSGYVSCSECSYDSESCTCVSADKCYCSLSRRVSAPIVPVPTFVCSCDTDSCSESNKCYCSRQSAAQPTILEQLRQKGIVPCETTLSRGGSSDRRKVNRTGRCFVSASRSLEFLKEQSSTQGSLDNLAVDYDLFRSGKRPQSCTIEDKILVVSARDPQGRLVYVGGADRDKKSSKDSPSRPGGHHEVLSIKKSAEIAAVFGSRSNRHCKRVNSASSLRSSVSLEAGLGYLP